MSAPNAAKLLAMPRFIPLPPPVTKTTLPLKAIFRDELVQLHTLSCTCTRKLKARRFARLKPSLDNFWRNAFLSTCRAASSAGYRQMDVLRRLNRALPVFDMSYEFIDRNVDASTQNDNCGNSSPHLLSGTPMTAAFATAGCDVSESSTSRGKNVEATADHHVLLAVNDVEKPVFIAAADITCMQPSVLQGFSGQIRQFQYCSMANGLRIQISPARHVRSPRHRPRLAERRPRRPEIARRRRDACARGHDPLCAGRSPDNTLSGHRAVRRPALFW